jgi:hypothetical protein
LVKVSRGTHIRKNYGKSFAFKKVCAGCVHARNLRRKLQLKPLAGLIAGDLTPLMNIHSTTVEH